MIKRKHPKYVRSFVDRHGHTRFYFQRGGGKDIPLSGLPWSPTFMTAYEAALGDRKAVIVNQTKAGTVDAAMLAYLQSDGFSKGLAKSTRDTRRRILTNFAKQHGDKRTLLMPADCDAAHCLQDDPGQSTWLQESDARLH